MEIIIIIVILSRIIFHKHIGKNLMNSDTSFFLLEIINLIKNRKIKQNLKEQTVKILFLLKKREVKKKKEKKTGIKKKT